MLNAVRIVEACQRNLPEPVLAAFSDAVFNLGPTVACDRSRSTAARLLATRQYDAACRQLPRWNKATVLGQSVELPGLTKRRAAEMKLCLGGEV
jgi:GH24 family phage-related lysozyme (muramidase)